MRHKNSLVNPGNESDLSAEQILTFGPYTLAITRRHLHRNGQPVTIGARTMDLLLALVARPGEVISKQNLMKQVWPHCIVDEASVRVQISALRRILCEGNKEQRYVVNVTQRGYQFVAPIGSPSIAERQRLICDWTIASNAHSKRDAFRAPAILATLFGREKVIREYSLWLNRGRCLTICGGPGVGKSSVALALLSCPTDAEHIFYFDAAGGQAARSDLEDIESVLAAAPSALLLIDNCEHRIDELAQVANRLLRHRVDLRLIVASREPLRIEGEIVRRLPPLSLLRDSQTCISPAGALFVHLYQAAAAIPNPASSEVNAIEFVCRQLGGNPLAIELAALRAITIGLEKLSHVICDPLRILTRGRRTAPSRHQSLRAAIDWSYALLSRNVQQTLRRLAVLSCPFTQDDAATLCNADDLFDDLCALVNSSLLLASIEGSLIRYRMPALVKLYAMEKLTDSNELEEIEERYSTLNMSQIDFTIPAA